MASRLVIAVAAIFFASSVQAETFRYHAPGVLVPAKSGKGLKSRKVYATNIRFPIQLAKNQDAYLNSQVWGVGGVDGREGPERSRSNYSMPWRDNYCEKRGWTMPLCPGGQGHQGVDIRGPSLSKDHWPVVAVENGQIEHVSRFSIVRLRGDSGIRYRYMHLQPFSIRVRTGQWVKQGDLIGRMSNYLGGRPNTTTHLHFDMEQTIKFSDGPQRVFIPPYASLVVAYRKMKRLPPGEQKGVLVVDRRREIR